MSVLGQSKIDKFKIAIIPYDSIFTWPFKNVKQTELNDKDLQLIESILKESVENYNTGVEKRYVEINKTHSAQNLKKENLLINLKKYKRQYFGVINSTGEKEVWINCMCNPNKNWRKELVIHTGGENCYFNLIVNLTTGKYYDFLVNENDEY